MCWEALLYMLAVCELPSRWYNCMCRGRGTLTARGSCLTGARAGPDEGECCSAGDVVASRLHSYLHAGSDSHIASGSCRTKESKGGRAGHACKDCEIARQTAVRGAKQVVL